jgi:cytoskeleton protein RodZ
MGTQENLLGAERPGEDDNFGGIGITIGTSIGQEERLRLSQGPAFDPERERNPYGDTSLAQLLRTTRESLGLSLDEVAETTRVRRTYLEAFELETYDVLPPRAFSIGYVKSYAKALGLDEETLAEMFKRDFADPHVSLRAPVGAAFEDVRPNYTPYIAAGLGLVAVVAVWNIVQWNPDILGAKDDAQASLASQPWSAGESLVRDGVIVVSKPAPAPKDQDVPEPYYTPGREAEFAAMAAEKRQADPVTALPESGLTRKAFNVKGAIYGAQPENSAVTIQATRPVSVVLRDTQGVVYNAKQLAAGEAFRVPLAGNQVVEVSDPKAFDVFYNGEYAGNMVQNVMPIALINVKAASSAKTLDSDITAARKPRIAATPPQARKPKAQSASSSASSSSVAPIPYVPPVQASSSSSSSSAEKPRRKPTSQRGAGPIIPNVN